MVVRKSKKLKHRKALLQGVVLSTLLSCQLYAQEPSQSSEKHPASAPAFAPDLVASKAPSGSKAFFAEGSARSVFGSEAKLTTPPEISILNAKAPETIVPDPSGTPPSEASEPKDLATELKEKYGSPDDDEFVAGEEHAPKAFKAALTAVQKGDDALALKYSRAYIRNLKRKQELVTRIQKLGDYAAEIEGTGRNYDFSQGPDYLGLSRVVEKEKESITAQESRHVVLDPNTKEIIQELSSDEPRVTEKEKTPPAPEAVRRQQYRAEFAQKLPRDPQGKVLVYVFFRPKHEASDDTVRAASTVYSLYQQNDPKIQFTALTLDEANEAEVIVFRQVRGLSIPIHDGRFLAQKLGARMSPTVVAIAPTTGEAYVSEGAKDEVFFDELVKFVRGEPQRKGEAQ